ncbi:MAG: DUF58 domain-containing protein [Deltaproteobacteria bacterium]|nr:DUF58 domain-containing protein [Deltaproteobacteria bacterium]
MGRLRNFFWRSSFFPRKLSFTREGKILVLVSLGLGFAAINTGNNLLYMVFGLSLALIIISGILSEANLRRLECLPLTSTRMAAGRTHRVVLSVVCGRRRFAAFSIEAWPLFDEPDLKVEPARFLELRPGETGVAACALTFPDRGEFKLRGMVLSTAFPFSFFVKSIVRPAEASVLVHPAVHPVAAEEITPTVGGDDEHRPAPGRGFEFFGVREFREGDNPRHVLHRKSASRLSPVVREFEELGSRSLGLVLVNAVDGGADLAGRVEAAVVRAASLAVHYIETGERVGLFTASGHVSPGTGPAQAERILDHLATIPVLLTDGAGLREASRRAMGPDDGTRLIRIRIPTDQIATTFHAPFTKRGGRQ